MYDSPTAQYWYSIIRKELQTTAATTITTTTSTATNTPLFRVFQSSKEMQGVRSPKWSGEVLLTESNIVKHHFVDVLGFYHLDEHLLTVGNLDLIDGWHFDETPKIFESMIFVNILCNNK